MKIRIENIEAIPKIVANEYKDLIIKKNNPTLGLATGSTPLILYKQLVEEYENKNISFKNCTTFNLDEYIGIDKNNINSYRYFMNKNLFNKVDIDIKNTHFPSTYHTSESDCLEYERKIANAGGIDLQLLGIGVNAHIAFNEPGTPFGSLTHVVELTPTTRTANARFFNNINEVPTHAVCMGIRTIMNTKKIILIALGEHKAQAIKDAVYGRISKRCPASILQLHPDVTIYCDKEAGSLL